MERVCCSIWKKLRDKWRTIEEKEITKLYDKGVPSYMFASVEDFLTNMNTCPQCGTNTTEGCTTSPVKGAVVDSSATPPTPSPKKKITCPKCRGKKTRGTDINGVTEYCSVCLGKGDVTAQQLNPDKLPAGLSDRLVKARVKAAEKQQNSKPEVKDNVE